jgi:hypothetical protein
VINILFSIFVSQFRDTENSFTIDQFYTFLVIIEYGVGIYSKCQC